MLLSALVLALLQLAPVLELLLRALVLAHRQLVSVLDLSQAGAWGQPPQARAVGRAWRPEEGWPLPPAALGALLSPLVPGPQLQAVVLGQSRALQQVALEEAAAACGGEAELQSCLKWRNSSTRLMACSLDIACRQWQASCKPAFPPRRTK